MLQMLPCLFSNLLLLSKSFILTDIFQHKTIFSLSLSLFSCLQYALIWEMQVVYLYKNARCALVCYS